MESPNSFTHSLWQGIEKTYFKILETDYVQNLANGSLDKKCFQHFIEQDIIYLNHDAETLMILAKRSGNKRHSDFFNTLAQDSILSEKELNKRYSETLEFKLVQTSSPAYKNYMDFLTEQVNNAPYPVALASKLPCYWIYTELGKYFLKNINSCNGYEEFAKAYASPEYLRFTEEYISIVEEEGMRASINIQADMKKVFNLAAQYELGNFVECGTIN